MADEAQSQYAAPPTVPSVGDANASKEAEAGKQTTITPSISVSEYYSNNVYFIPGRKLYDYVTAVVPQVLVDHKGREVDASIQGGISANYFARNPGLDYIAANGTATVDLTRAIEKLVRGASLQATDTFSYSPYPPAFLAPTTGNVVDTGFVQGVKAQRANSLSNMGTANVGYQLTPTIALQASYVNSMMRFGKQFTPPGQSSPFPSGSFFTTHYQTVTAGPKFQVSPRDSINVNYQYQQMAFTFSTGSTFEMQGGMVGWKRKLTPDLTASATGGFVVITPGNILQYTGNALVQWTRESTSVVLQYQRSVKPSFFLIGVPLVSQIYSLNVTQYITQPLSLTGAVNYVQSAAATSPSLLSITTYFLSFGVNYQLAEHVSTTLSYGYSDFAYRVQGGEVAYNRYQVTLMLRAEW